MEIAPPCVRIMIGRLASMRWVHECKIPLLFTFHSTCPIWFEIFRTSRVITVAAVICGTKIPKLLEDEIGDCEPTVNVGGEVQELLTTVCSPSDVADEIVSFFG